MSPLYDVYLQAYDVNQANPRWSRAQIQEAIKIPEGFDQSELERVIKAACYGPKLGEDELAEAIKLSKLSAAAVNAVAPRESTMEHRVSPPGRNRS